MGTGSPPPIYTKVKVCERMHWTLLEYDRQPADEMAAMVAILNITKPEKNNR